jgi:hypothetical protein
MPYWSRDGKRIYFFSNRSGKDEMWSINRDGSRLERLDYLSGLDLFSPVWSPDGTRLAYNSLRDAYVMEVDKSWKEQTLRALPHLSDSTAFYPKTFFLLSSWAPDGRSLAGIERLEDSSSTGVVIFSLEYQEFQKLTDFGRGPVWLSDNRRLLFGYEGRIYLVDSQSKRTHEVLSLPHGIGWGFALSQDDRMLYFTLFTNEADIWLARLEQ